MCVQWYLYVCAKTNGIEEYSSQKRPEEVAAWIEFVNRIIVGVGIPIGSHTCFGDGKPIRLNKPPKLGIIVARIDELQAGVGVITPHQ